MKRISRKDFLKEAAWGGLSSLLVSRLASGGGVQTSAAPFDIVIRNGRVIDGTGTPAFAAAVGIRGGRIVDIGDIPASAGRQVIDAASRPGSSTPTRTRRSSSIPRHTRSRALPKSIPTSRAGLLPACPASW